MDVYEHLESEAKGVMKLLAPQDRVTIERFYKYKEELAVKKRGKLLRAISGFTAVISVAVFGGSVFYTCFNHTVERVEVPAPVPTVGWYASGGIWRFDTSMYACYSQTREGQTLMCLKQEKPMKEVPAFGETE